MQVILVKSVIRRIAGKLFSQIVPIRALAMRDFAEKPQSFHIEREKFELPVATIFHHHYGRFGPFVTSYELPKAFYAVSPAYLACNRDSSFHSLFGYF